MKTSRACLGFALLASAGFVLSACTSQGDDDAPYEETPATQMESEPPAPYPDESMDAASDASADVGTNGASSYSGGDDDEPYTGATDDPAPGTEDDDGPVP